MRARILLVLTASALLAACAALPPFFSQYSSDETARLKAESLVLIAAAEQSNTLHAQRAEALLSGVESAYRDANLRSRNRASLRQWGLLLDTAQPSLAGAFLLWKRNDTLSAAAIADFQRLIAGNFDEITKLEGNKRK